MAAFGALTILMDTLHQNFLQPTPLFPLRNKTKVSSLYRNLSSLRTSLEHDFKLGEYDEAIKPLNEQLRDVSVELRFQIEHELRLFYLGKSMKLRLHSAQKLLPILSGAIKGGTESMDFNCVMEILRKHFTLPSKNEQQIYYDDEQESKNEQQIDDDDDKECRLLLNIITLVWRVSSQIKKEVKSCFRRERKSDDDEQESNNEQQIDDDEESEDDEQDSDDDEESKDDEQEAERRRYMLLYEAESVIRQELRASYLNKYMKQRIQATQRIRQLFIQGISLTSSINKHMLKVKNAYHQSNNSQNNNPSSLRGLELDTITDLRVHEYSSCEPLDIWGLPQLKNIRVSASVTLIPPRSVHHNLESIRSLDYRSCTKKLFLRIPNLRTLQVTTNHEIKCKAPNWFESLVYLYKLEVLMVDAELGEFSTLYSMGMLSLENFWPSLKRLDLSNTNLKWEDMDVVGKLSKLEDLRLMRDVVKDQKWKPKDGGFRQLRFLKIYWGPLQYWEATSNHFPVLEKLDLGLIKLKEIPTDFVGKITLKSIKLYECSKSLISSAKFIQKKQQEEYGYTTHLLIFPG
nr:putative disease resistance RPP13-like protein 3 [Ipomoea batatas]